MDFRFVAGRLGGLAKQLIQPAQMSFAEFQQSITRDPAAPAGLSAPLRALWLSARGDWDGAHALVQSDGGRDGAWVHAYLHRTEGDDSNAGYWYSRAGRPAPGEGPDSLAREWEQIARAFLADHRTTGGME
jgi:hypothetical protein